MSTAFDKAKIAGIVAVFGAISAFVYGFANFVLLAGLGTFFASLSIQYGSLKIKILVPLATLLGLASWSTFNGGLDS